ncbi:MAG: hypothetical protein WC791_02925 [Candidatus Paceibacterota bacterium]|jgi:hypothetical protein
METDIKVIRSKGKTSTKVVPDVAPVSIPEVAPSVVYDEPHHGKLIAVVIVGVLVIVAILVGVFSFGGGKKSANTIAGSNSNTATTTLAPVVVPTENFVIADTSSRKSAPTASEEIATKTVGEVGINEQVSPANFKSFSYDATIGKKISVSGTCHDAYYALLIFGSKDDYRASPGSARANRAYECGTSGLFTIKMDLRDINLPSGEYYLFIADQGKTGSWYNPR